MSKKRKPQEIRVDKLIVKANEVIVIDEKSRRRRYDPWLGRRMDDIEDIDVEVDVDVDVKVDDDKVDVDVDVDVDDDDRKRPFSWI
ncbi:hypothetical protein IM538_05660 [Cytobacillus suaedae]|nr:hypothetical protein IM538_05660 [Cytobacillus suaedae]